MRHFIHRRVVQVCSSVYLSKVELTYIFNLRPSLSKSIERFSFYSAPRARGRNHISITIRTIDQTELIIFIRFEVVDTLSSSQVLFWYQDFPPSQTVLSLQGLGILRRARGRNQYKYVAARPPRIKPAKPLTLKYEIR